MKLIGNIRAAIWHIKTVAEQLPSVDSWRSFIDYVTKKIIDASANSSSKIVHLFDGNCLIWDYLGYPFPTPGKARQTASHFL